MHRGLRSVTEVVTTSSYLRFHQSEVCAVLYDISMFLSVP